MITGRNGLSNYSSAFGTELDASDIIYQDNQIDGFATPISDFRKG
jgi:hypothetical protein